MTSGWCDTLAWVAALARVLPQLAIRDPVVLFVLETSETVSSDGAMGTDGKHVFPMILPLEELLGHQALPAEVRDLVAGTHGRSDVVRCVVQEGVEWHWMPLPLDPVVLRKLSGVDGGVVEP